MLALGICLFILALTMFVYCLYAPPVPLVPAARRVAPGSGEPKAGLTRFVEFLENLVDRVLRHGGWNPFPASTLELAGIRVPQSAVVTAILSVTFLAFLVGNLFGGALVGLLAAILMPVVGRGYVNRSRRKRRDAFADQLVGTLEVICSALRAGHSFPTALDSVAADAQVPTDEEFARIVNAGRLGLDVVEAMHETSHRMENQDFAWVADGLAIQRDTGGNLGEILERISQTIRERTELAQKVRAISAEGRVSAWVMMAVPPGLAAFLAFMNPVVFRSAFLSSTGLMLLGVCAVLYVGGFFWIRKLVTVEV
jgi:tight adherence protein B